MPGRRWSDGLHQAVEAKEGVDIEAENQTLATITFQNYFRMYNKLCGMTGTADTEAVEFKRIYNLEVMVIPTNKPMVRKDYHDMIYKTELGKYQAVVKEIEECQKKGQPVLVGTISIEKSERLSHMLKNAGITHSVLNAKQHQREAEIVAEAGQRGTVTISTNMAGRGTDIKLGPGVQEAGGLHILGTERHESRRIDNQLRGRSGRQGDPGSSRFYLSLEDDLMRIFGGDRLKNFMDRLGMKDDEAIEHRYISKSIENAQKKVEGHNFDIRKHLLEYDDVMNQQRKVVYGRRRLILSQESIKNLVLEMIDEMVEAIVGEFVGPKQTSSDWDAKGFCDAVKSVFDIPIEETELKKNNGHGTSFEELSKWTRDRVLKRYEEKITEVGAEIFPNFERMLYLQSIDHHWKEHLLSMDHLKEGIGLQGYGQKDPLVEYKKEGYNLFVTMDQLVKNDFLGKLFRMQVRVAPAGPEHMPPEEVEQREQLRHQVAEQELKKIEARLQRAQDRMQFAGSRTEEARPTKTAAPKVGRNDPCPCGSGKKYKKCHGANV
jgi:preprotein translocase subunit SecA